MDQCVAGEVSFGPFDDGKRLLRFAASVERRRKVVVYLGNIRRQVKRKPVFAQRFAQLSGCEIVSGKLAVCRWAGGIQFDRCTQRRFAIIHDRSQ